MKYGVKRSSLLLVDVFAEVAQVNAEALNKKYYQHRQNTSEEVPRQNVFSYSYLRISFAAAKNAEIQGLKKLYNNIMNSIKI